MKPLAKSSDDIYHIHYDNYLNTNASTECTGILYQPAQDGAEWEDAQDIFHFFPEQAMPSHDKAANHTSAKHPLPDTSTKHAPDIK